MFPIGRRRSFIRTAVVRTVASGLAALAALGVALAVARPATATFPGRNGLIAFSTDRHPLLNHPQVFSLGMHGRRRRNVSASSADDVDPSPSPDGRRIAFSRRGDIWVMNADGTGQRQLAHGGSHPVWSPDGKTLAFNGAGPGECPPGAYRCGHLVAVWTVRLDGSRLRRFEPASRNASWSPSGRWIAYEGAIDTRTEVPTAYASRRPMGRAPAGYRAPAGTQLGLRAEV
jgi:dipeptidyl aminopeptidase/acylaminoacyl peptidase